MLLTDYSNNLWPIINFSHRKISWNSLDIWLCRWLSLRMTETSANSSDGWYFSFSQLVFKTKVNNVSEMKNIRDWDWFPYKQIRHYVNPHNVLFLGYGVSNSSCIILDNPRMGFTIYLMEHLWYISGPILGGYALLNVCSTLISDWFIKY